MFCPMLQIGPCDYLEELRPLTPLARLTADTALGLHQERQVQAGLLAGITETVAPVEQAWGATDEPDEINLALSSPIAVDDPGSARPGPAAGR